MENTTQKMNKIPFDLERAKKGEAFRINDDDAYDNFYISHCAIDYNKTYVFFKFTDSEGTFAISRLIHTDWHHLIPEKPKAERWAVVNKSDIYSTKEGAEQFKGLSKIYTVVKLADEI